MLSIIKSAMVKIGTHNGSFHCDEALACALLKRLPKFADAEIVRSRDPSVLDECDIVVDVGGVFDPEKQRYDHHQKSFNHTMNSLNKGPWNTKLSSAGLVYAFYGKEVLKEMIKNDSESLLDKIYDKVYENFLEEIDAVDNGIAACDDPPKYKVTSTLSSRVGHLRPSWQDQHQDFDAGFSKAMELVIKEFDDRVNFYANDWWPARDLVYKALEARFEVHSSGKIIVLENGGCPFKEHLYQLEEEQQIVGEILFALFPDTNGSWRVLTITVKDKQFESRLNLPEEWRGLRDAELSEKSEIRDCIFVHATGFIGGNQSKEGALKMAIAALRLQKIIS